MVIPGGRDKLRKERLLFFTKINSQSPQHPAATKLAHKIEAVHQLLQPFLELRCSFPYRLDEAVPVQALKDVEGRSGGDRPSAKRGAVISRGYQVVDSGGNQGGAER